jgi:hypothetical protein
MIETEAFASFARPGRHKTLLKMPSPATAQGENGKAWQH